MLITLHTVKIRNSMSFVWRWRMRTSRPLMVRCVGHGRIRGQVAGDTRCARGQQDATLRVAGGPPDCAPCDGVLDADCASRARPETSTSAGFYRFLNAAVELSFRTIRIDKIQGGMEFIRAPAVCAPENVQAFCSARDCRARGFPTPRRLGAARVEAHGTLNQAGRAGVRAGTVTAGARQAPWHARLLRGARVPDFSSKRICVISNYVCRHPRQGAGEPFAADPYQCDRVTASAGSADGKNA